MFSYKIVGWFVLISTILFGLYNECESREYVKKRSRWTMNVSERFDYKKRRFCSVPVWFLVLVALALTFTFNVNKYTTYASVSLLVLYTLFIFF
jgi:hypothetical protein